MMCTYLQSWKLPDGNFYPLSVVNHLEAGQNSAVIIVSSAEQVFSVTVGDLDDAVHENSGPVSFVKCNLGQRSGSICALEWAGSNSAVVTTDGKLMVYDYAANKLSCVEKLSGIKHVDGLETNQLFVVRHREGGPTALEVVDTTDGLSYSTTVKSYDIIADSIDSDAKFCIRTFTVTEKNQRFLGDFLGFSKLSSGQKVIVMAIYNQLYWLQERAEGECDLITVRCFSSSVLSFDFCESSLCLTVLLEVGVLLVFNQSPHPDALLVSSSPVYLQPPIEAHAFDKVNNLFLYSNGLTTYLIRYHFSEETEQLVAETEQIPVFGVVAITLIDKKGLALLLTENRQFYAVDCTRTSQDIVGKHSSMMVTLQKEMRSEARRATKTLTDEVEFDKRLDQAIQHEQAHFQVLALHRNKNVFGKLSRMVTTLHQEMPVSKCNTLFVQNQVEQAPCLFASVQIEINLGFFELLMKQKRWMICIEYYENVLMYPVHETFDEKAVFHATLFLCRNQLAQGLPSFRAYLFASVRNGNDNLLLNIPVASNLSTKTETGHLIKKLESASIMQKNDTTHPAFQLVLQNNPLPVKCMARPKLTYCIQNELSKTKAATFSSVLENHLRDTWSVFAEMVTVAWHNGKDSLFLNTHNPVVMDLVKRFLLPDYEYCSEMKQRLGKLKGVCLELEAVSCAELIVQLYQRTRNNGLFVD